MDPSLWQLQFVFPKHSAETRGPQLRAGWDSELTQCARNKLSELGLPRLAERVSVVWNRRMRSTAGRAMWPKALVELNPALEEISRDEVHRTLLHELAHLVAYERCHSHDIRPHGPEWQRACRELGIPGESASHHLPLPSRRLKKRWRYICPRCWACVERVRRMKGHNACYSCCKRFNRGAYDERYRFLEQRLPG